MDGMVIRFPVERRRPATPEPERPAGPAGSGALPVPAEAGDQARGFALLSVELRRNSSEVSLDPNIAGQVLNRCVLAALEVLSRAKAIVELAGTTSRPVIDARFEGLHSELEAVRAATTIRDAVRRVQRRVENEVQVAGAVASGAAAETKEGVTVTLGAPEDVAIRLRERAAPGQILLTEPVWSACSDKVDGRPAGSPVDVGLGNPMAVFALNGLREPNDS